MSLKEKKKIVRQTLIEVSRYGRKWKKGFRGEKKGVRVWAYLNIYPWMTEDRIGFWLFPSAYAVPPPPHTHILNTPIYTHGPSGLQNVAKFSVGPTEKNLHE